MKNQWLCASITTLLLCGASACKDEPAATTTTTTSPTPPAQTPTEIAPTPVPAETNVAPATLSSSDQDFVTKATQGGLLEVALGREASTKAVSPDVKSFGDHMVKDHASSGEELKQLATKKGAAPPTELDKDHKKKLDELSKLNGGKFDKEYSAAMVEDHEEDVKEFRTASLNLKDPDLRTWAAKTLPTLESHLAMAKELKAKAKH